MVKEEKKKKPLWVKLLIFYLCIVAYFLMFFAIGGKDVDLKRVETSKVTVSDNIGEILEGDIVEQKFISEVSQIDSVNLSIGTYNRTNTGTLILELLQGNNCLNKTELNMEDLVNGENEIVFSSPVEVTKGEEYTYKISTKNASAGNSVTIYYGPQKSDGVSLVAKTVDLKKQELVFSIEGKVEEPLGKVFKYGTCVILIALGLYLLHVLDYRKKGKMTIGLQFLDAVHQYTFLMEQLVIRAFKVRYKRSVLGVLWSFMNPLLTMIVQYFVFTLVFKSAIDHYIVYLLIGITFFNFYSESTNNGLLSIITNAALIKKVYVPKYIYPLSQIFSAAINFVISLILMFGITFISGLHPNVYMLLIPYIIFCIFLLNIGVSLILATGMTFFRDVQFINNVFMTMLTYATPLFWELSMIPDKYLWIFKLNPLCDIITFVREIVLYNRYPGTELILLSLVIPVIFLVLGIYVFKKNQDKFILFI